MAWLRMKTDQQGTWGVRAKPGALDTEAEVLLKA